MELPITPELILILGFMSSISGMLFLSLNYNTGWILFGIGYASFIPILPETISILPFIALSIAISISVIKKIMK